MIVFYLFIWVLSLGTSCHF